MISATKRVFNGNLSKLSTAYFGKKFDGTDIVLKVSPMLIFTAMNEDIKDDALKSRFDFINYPSPNINVLSTYAVKLVQKSKMLNQAETIPSLLEINAWIMGLEIENRNFRYIESNVEAHFLQKRWI